MHKTYANLIKEVRKEIRFTSPAELAKQIAIDIKNTEKELMDYE